MKNTKIKRIAAVIGCVLVLISVFVVPAAAAPALDPQPESPAAVYSAFYDYIPDKMRSAPSFYNYVLDVQNAYQNSTNPTWQGYFMSSTSLTSGNVDIFGLGYPFYEAGADLDWTAGIDYSIELNGEFYSGLNSLCQIYFWDYGGGNTRCTITLLDDQTSLRFGGVVFTIDSAYINSLGSFASELYSVELLYVGEQPGVNESFYGGDIESLSVTFADHYDNTIAGGDDGFVNFLGGIFFNDARDNTRSPYSYYYGFCDGVTSEPDNVAFQRGYDAAIRDIDSGDFGRNFIGNILHSPFSMLRNFTVVSWKFGTTLVTITMADLLSTVIGVGLFIWLLKVFAGG